MKYIDGGGYIPTLACSSQVFLLPLSQIKSNMREVAKTFNGPGREDLNSVKFTQLFRKGLIALYSRSDGEYEVVTLKTRKAETYIIEGRKIDVPDRELYPKGEDWGKYGKFFHSKNYDMALEFYNNAI